LVTEGDDFAVDGIEQREPIADFFRQAKLELRGERIDCGLRRFFAMGQTAHAVGHGDELQVIADKPAVLIGAAVVPDVRTRGEFEAESH
jgi:hypothetical protein